MTTRGTRRGRYFAFFAAFLAADAAIVMAACSTSSPDSEDGTDATTEVGPSKEAGADGPVAPKPDAGREGGGNCSPANDKCDIVLQNCPPQQECVIGNGGKTLCQAVEASEQLPLGRACCPDSANPCLPGLTCVGGQECVDGGPKTGRCSPACCKGDDQACGKSDPEGISGECTLQLVDSQNRDLYNICTYSQVCKPFKVQPCNTGETCIVSDKVGTASCIGLFGPGKTNRQPCSLANDCADGFVCTGDPDAGTCHYVCLLPGSTHPFDAGVENGGPGYGGCPAGEKCDLRFQNTPGWFAACSLDGG